MLFRKAHDYFEVRLFLYSVSHSFDVKAEIMPMFTLGKSSLLFRHFQTPPHLLYKFASAQALWSSVSRPPSPSKLAQCVIATRLTQRHKRKVKGSDVPPVKVPKTERVCRGCGKTVQGDSTNCAECDIDIATMRLVEVARAGRVAGHTPEAIAKEAATHGKHAQARAAWNPTQQPTWLTEQVFSEKIQPALARASASAIARKIGVSRWYAGRIREGYCPHPRHWLALAQLAGFSGGG
jgi:hypothetical protein